ncbi:MAG: hypothetical protein IPK07_00295 [Deltaproteobacteria bacterium]|nr:hypothetical protein [Deltaproteobacteria bacterium]
MSKPVGYRARALHYLVLRHLADVAAARGVEPALHREVAESLEVTAAEGGFWLTWSAAGESGERWVERGDFALFRPGDGARAATSYSSSVNERRAENLALALLGLAAIEAERERSLPVRAVLTSPLALVLPAAVIAAGGVNGIALAAALLVWSIVDGVPRVGPLLAVLPLTTLAYAGLPRAAILGGSVYALFQLLDPDPRLRWPRVAALAAAVGFAAWLTPSAGLPVEGGAWLLPIALGAPVAFALRWSLGSHARTLPLVLPFAALGLAWDGRPREALAVLAVSVVSSAALALKAPVVRLRRARRRAA